MSIIFFGKCSNDWMNALNESLIPEFSIYTKLNINEIKNVYDINELAKMDLSSAYVIPLMEKHMIQLYNKKIKAIMPIIDHVNIFSCKKMFSSYVKTYFLEQYTPKVYNSIDEVNDNGIYIIKPYELNNGSSMFIKKSLDETDFCNKIVQEYIENTVEYSSYTVTKNGKIIKCITYECAFDNVQHIKRYPENTNGMTKVELDEKYVKQLELFFLPLGYNGISNTDFIIHNGQVKVFEINPRLGGGLLRSNKCDVVEMLNEMINVNE
jgi:predicted ATP-grasp superfamily ATP-dependent carboligase